jgi:hypothetical protein
MKSDGFCFGHGPQRYNAEGQRTDMGHIDYFRFNRMSFNEGWAQFFPDRLQHLRIRLVCNLYPDRISVCYHFFPFWKDPGR